MIIIKINLVVLTWGGREVGTWPWTYTPEKKISQLQLRGFCSYSSWSFCLQARSIMHQSRMKSGAKPTKKEEKMWPSVSISNSSNIYARLQFKSSGMLTHMLYELKSLPTKRYGPFFTKEKTKEIHSLRTHKERLCSWVCLLKR